MHMEAAMSYMIVTTAVVFDVAFSCAFATRNLLERLTPICLRISVSFRLQRSFPGLTSPCRAHALAKNHEI
ncbi:hypothetical protein BJV74DRAFT_174764 [Russula compacta]|nr:hypothetical protein BJV74DRAFT_174764 [Russula compacta]